MPPTPPGNIAGAQSSQINNLMAGYGYSHMSFPCAELFTLEVYSQDSHHNTDYDPDMPTAEETSTGEYTICCVVAQLTSIWKTRAACYWNLQLMTSNDIKERDFADY